MTFEKMTESLYARITSQDLANTMKVPLQSIRQAQMSPDKTGHRSPPHGWEKAARVLAEAQVAHFTKLAARLRASE